MIIKSLSEITPDLISITIDESFHESLNDAIFPENLQEIIINLTCNNIELIQENELYDDINLNDASDNEIENDSDNEENIINNNI